MPAPARPISARGVMELTTRPLVSRFSDFNNVRRGETVAEAPASSEVHGRLLKVENEAREMNGVLKRITERVDEMFSTPREAIGLNRFVHTVDPVEGTNFGVHTIVKMVENPSVEASTTLTDQVRTLINNLRKVNIETGKMAVDNTGNGPNTIRRTPVDVGDMARAIIEIGKPVEPGSQLELELAKRFSRGNEGVEQRVGHLMRGNDGHYRPFIPTDGAKFVRMPTEELSSIILEGRSNAHANEFAEVIAAHPLNQQAGLTVERVWSEYLDPMRARLDKTGAEAIDGDGSIALEIARAIPWVPTAMKVNGKWENLFEVSPTAYSRRLRESHSQHIAFARNFGQNVGETYFDRNTNELVEVVRNDQWSPLVRDVVKEHGRQEPAMLLGQIQRVMNGLPLSRSRVTPFSFEWKAKKAWETGSQLLRAMMLSANALTNIPETFVGSASAQFGFRNNLKSMADLVKMGKAGRETIRTYHDELDSISRFMSDFSFNPNHPFRESVRIATQQAGRFTGSTMINEWQEMIGPVLAYEKLTNWNLGRVEPRDRAMLESMESFTKPQIDALLKGVADNRTQEAFVRGQAQMLTGSPLSRTMMSRAELSPTFKTFIPFMSYGIAKMNMFGRAMRGVGKAYDELRGQGKDKVGAAMGAMQSPAGQLLGRHVGYTTAQGAGGALLLALAFGGTTGLSVALNEAEDQPAKFIAESFIYSALTGPYGQAIRYMTNPADPPSAVLAKSTFPGALLDETHAMLTAQGPYKDMTPFDRVVEFFRRKTPANGPLSTVLAIVGLSDRDAALEGSIRGYWKWRFSNARPGKVSAGEASKEDIKFRQAMKRAMGAIRKNQDPMPYIEEALAVDGKDAKAAKASILSRRLIQPLDQQEQESLRKRIGDKGFDKLLSYDALLESWAEDVA